MCGTKYMMSEIESSFQSVLAQELPHILAALTPVTGLVHDPELCAALDELVARRGLGIRRVVVLSADPGLEAYTVAMRLSWHWRHTPQPPFQVLGLLLCHEDLQTARRGVYPMEVLPCPVPSWLAPWITRHRRQPWVRIAPAVRFRVRFRHLPWPCAVRLREAADLLWCCGVFDPFVLPLGGRLVLEAARVVRPGGFVITDVSLDACRERGLRLLAPGVYQTVHWWRMS